jgi:hypothetical protein
VPTVNPWDANWRPDPTGRRLATIRTARRGGLLAAGIFGCLVAVAVAIALPTIGPRPAGDVSAPVALALFSLPALALLGAALTPAAVGSRWSAVGAGLAIGLGVPVAAVTSAMIGAFVGGWLTGGPHEGAAVAGRILRWGVTAAVRIAPLIAAASFGWVLLVRRVDQTD